MKVFSKLGVGTLLVVAVGCGPEEEDSIATAGDDVSGKVVGDLAIVLVETKDEDIVVQIDLGGFGWIATYWYSVERR